MAKHTPAHSAVSDFIALQEALFLALPVASVRRSLGVGTEKEAAEAAWHAYDVGVQLLTTSVDSVYHNPVFGESVAVLSESFLRWQRLSTALSGTFGAGLRQALDLVSATDLQVLHEQIQSLREEVRSVLTTPLTLANVPQPGITTMGEQTAPLNSPAWQHALRALRHARPPNVSAEPQASPLPQVAPQAQASAWPVDDVHDYFEPVADVTTGGFDPVHDADRESDLHAYFEPVADAPGNPRHAAHTAGETDTPPQLNPVPAKSAEPLRPAPYSHSGQHGRYSQKPVKERTAY